MKTCSVCGSTLNRGAKRYCGLACYRQIQRSGDAHERFWSKVRKTEKCWLWTGSLIGQNGYGQFHYDRQNVYAHRLSWEMAHGPIPAGQSVLHSCDQPICVNPSHLFLGTQKTNMEDAAAKGRLSVPRPSARKLDDEQREIVRERYRAGDVTMQALADDLGVSKPYIWQIVHKRSVEFRKKAGAA